MIEAASNPTIDKVHRVAYEFGLPVDHADYGIVEPIVSGLLKHGGGWDSFAVEVGVLIRKAVDAVIDTANNNRFTLSETEKTEKTYLGTKIEILFRAMLKLPKGRTLDLSVDGADVDIKNTMGKNWAIPQEAISRPCVLIREDELSAVCSIGVNLAETRYLSLGQNPDRERTISAVGNTTPTISRSR